MNMTLETRLRVALTGPFGLVGIALAGAVIVGLILQRAVF
jgi:hypothetical protein